MRIHVPHGGPPPTVAGLMNHRVQTVGADCPFSNVVAALVALRAGDDLYVLDRSSRYVGAITLDHLEPLLVEAVHLRAVIAADLVDPAIEPVAPSTTLAQLARRFARSSVERLPVVDGHRGLLGSVGRIELALHG